MHWLKKAIKNKDMKAHLMMGATFESGMTVKRDYKEAIKWYTAAHGLAGKKDTPATSIGRLYCIFQLN